MRSACSWEEACESYRSNGSFTPYQQPRSDNRNVGPPERILKIIFNRKISKKAGG